MVTSVLLLAALQPALAANRSTDNFADFQTALDAVQNGDTLTINGLNNGQPIPATGTVYNAPARNFEIIGGTSTWAGNTLMLPAGSEVVLRDYTTTCDLGEDFIFNTALEVHGTISFDNVQMDCHADGVAEFFAGSELVDSGGAPSNFSFNNSVFFGTGDTAVVRDMVFTNNFRNGDFQGGSALRFDGFDSVTIETSSFVSNRGTGGRGGAVYLADIGATRIEASDFRYNYNLVFTFIDDDQLGNGGDSAGFLIASGEGAGLYVEGGDFSQELELLGNVFDGNFAWDGGGASIRDLRFVNMYNNLFAANWTYHLAGALQMWVDDRSDPWGEDYRWPAEPSEAPSYDLIPSDVFGDGPKIINNTFVLNTAGLTIDPEEVVVVGGGAAALFHGFRPDFRNNIVSHSYYGGGVLLHEGVNFAQGDDLNWEYNMFYWNCDVFQCVEDFTDDHRNVTSNGEESGYALHPNNIIEQDPDFYYVGDLRDSIIDFDAYPDVFCTDFESLAVRNGDPLEEQESSVALAGAAYSDIGMCGGQLAHLYWNADRDGDGFEQYYDCLDEPDEPESIETFPGAQEDCDFQDNDCDGTIDEGYVTTWYEDADGDGYGNTEVLPALVCPDQAPVGSVSVGGDCDDTNIGANEGEVEICDGVDNDCDGVADQGDLEYVTVYRDSDGDGFGALSAPREACLNSQTGVYFEAVGTESLVLPGSAASWVDNSEDCDDSDPTVNPDAEEDCTIADRNCNGDSYDADSAPEYFIDLDADGYGEGTTGFGVRACDVSQLPTPTEGVYVPNGDDCDNTNADINPGAAEICDDIDNDCDTRIDVDPVDAPLLYEDYDNDGYGNPATALRSCDPGASYTTTQGGDCDDSDPTVTECSECGCQATPTPAGTGAMMVLLASLLGLRRRRK